MSRYYRMDIEVSEYNEKMMEVIKTAATAEWDLDDDWYCRTSDSYGELPFMSASGKSNLCGGESEEEFTLRLTKAIWKANGAFCLVVVNATYLESPPFETHHFDESVYQEMMRREKAIPLT